MIEQTVSLAPDEKILTVVRRHWFPLAVQGVAYGFMFVVVVVGALSGALTLTTAAILPGDDAFGLALFTIGFFGLVLWVRFFAAWSDHYLDAWIISNRRIIDVEQHGFFSREVSSFPIDRVQDVTFEAVGFIATLLNFGNVRIQTASISEDFIMRMIPDPDGTKERVLDVVREVQDARREHYPQ